jgi:hypothetical protein
MRTEAEIRREGMHALLKTLGDVDAERFMTLILKEPFDYTQWQSELWADESVASISEKAKALREEHP